MLGFTDVFDVYKGDASKRQSRLNRLGRLVGFLILALIFFLTIRALW